jgi:hypothetical protein
LKLFGSLEPRVQGLVVWGLLPKQLVVLGGLKCNFFKK